MTLKPSRGSIGSNPGRNAGLKATGAWGRPWANPAALKPMLGALPKAKGTAILKPALNAK